MAKSLALYELLQSSLKHQRARRICFFSDEKIFVVDNKINRRKDRGALPGLSRCSSEDDDETIIANHGAGSHLQSRPHHATTVLRKRRIGLPKDLLEGLQEAVKPWIEEIIRAYTGGSPYAFQQDAVPPLTAHVVINGMQDNQDMVRTPNFWPHSCPDLSHSTISFGAK